MAKKKTPQPKKGKMKKAAESKKEEPRQKGIEPRPIPEVGPCLRAYESLLSRLSQKDRSRMTAELELLHDAVVGCPVSCGCSKQEKTSVIFSADGIFLGEMMTRSGGFTSLIMSRAGDELLGPVVESWQVMGLTQDEAAGPIKMRDEDFLDAFGVWCGNNGCRLVTLLAPQIELWNATQTAPLTDREKLDVIERLAQEPLETALESLDSMIGGRS